MLQATVRAAGLSEGRSVRLEQCAETDSGTSRQSTRGHPLLPTEHAQGQLPTA